MTPLVEYAAALKDKNLELKSVGGSDVSAVRNLSNTAASVVTTNATAALIKEMKRAQEAHTTQIHQLTALVAMSTTNNKPNPAARGGG